MILPARMEAVLRTGAAAALAVLLVVATPGSAGAASTITRSDLTGTSFVNPCTAEVITITGGSFQLIASVTADAAVASTSTSGAVRRVSKPWAPPAVTCTACRGISGASRASATPATR